MIDLAWDVHQPGTAWWEVEGGEGEDYVEHAQDRSLWRERWEEGDRELGEANDYWPTIAELKSGINSKRPFLLNILSIGTHETDMNALNGT